MSSLKASFSAAMSLGIWQGFAKGSGFKALHCGTAIGTKLVLQL